MPAVYFSRTLTESLQLCRKCNGSALGRSFRSWKEFPLVNHPCFEPGLDLVLDGRACVEFPQQRVVVDTIKAFGYVGIQDPFGFLVDADIDGSDRIPGGASRSKAVAVGFKARFPLGCKCHGD